MAPFSPFSRSLYAAFDVFPSAKGAAVHIDRFARTLFEHAGGGTLAVLGAEDHPMLQREGNIEIRRMPGTEPNFLRRALAFSEMVRHIAVHNASSLKICQFRDPWSGYSLVANPDRRYRTVYEVNGLPSIELPHTYPGVQGKILDEITGVEDFCLEKADRIVVPAEALRRCLVERGAAENRITVIPNGADLPEETPSRTPGMPERFLLYFGALQEWQGIETLLESFSLLKDFSGLFLVICASERSPREKSYFKLARRLDIADRVIWRWRLPQEELAPWRAHALLAVAPLKDCPRNTRQGCSPLKILEAMAAGVPVVASDLPPVREIVDDEKTGFLVRADDPSALARRIRVALSCPEKTAAIARAARALARSTYTWKSSCERLKNVYDMLESCVEMQEGVSQ